MKFLVNKPKYKIVKRFAWLPTTVRQNKADTKRIKYWLRTYFAVYEHTRNQWQEIYVSNQLKNCQKVLDKVLMLDYQLKFEREKNKKIDEL